MLIGSSSGIAQIVIIGVIKYSSPSISKFNSILPILLSVAGSLFVIVIIPIGFEIKSIKTLVPLLSL
jgi:hypothetical protein